MPTGNAPRLMRGGLQCAEDDQGKAMLEGEFHSMSELHKTSPGFVPKPYSWGKLCVSSPDTYYFLCDFIEMIDQNPHPVQLCSKLVQLYQASESPTGMFGFHISTCQGNLPETSRSIVGNGSREVSALHRPLYRYLSCSPAKARHADGPALTDEDPTRRNSRIRIPNPLATLKILAGRNALLITAIYGVYYMIFSCLQSTSTVSRSWRPDSSTCLSAWGRVLGRTAQVFPVPSLHTILVIIVMLNSTNGDNMASFPIEKARFRSIWYWICATRFSTAGYGWALQGGAVYQQHKPTNPLCLFICLLASIHPSDSAIYRRRRDRNYIQRPDRPAARFLQTKTPDHSQQRKK
ncbi:uncharacterized protein BJX67DRAFT_386336 [Aspergillus lucknowensis]|uniref:Uncharacterized protein n=1 Tax=Aspergillus lucknowensis TaxID=176173 RepID=A0ABR4L8A9_9EURO